MQVFVALRRASQGWDVFLHLLPCQAPQNPQERIPHRVLPRRPWQPSGKRMVWSASCRRIRVADNGPHSNLSYVTLDMMFTPEPRSQKASEKTWGSDGALDRLAAMIIFLGHERRVKEWAIAWFSGGLPNLVVTNLTDSTWSLDFLGILAPFASLKKQVEHCSGWFVVREKHCSG